ncbi:MAG: hypothetical protein M3416_02490 [Acidobacteriota bacterium]|nr:hypothetical protein [Acidobacteriota bacterium]
MPADLLGEAFFRILVGDTGDDATFAPDGRGFALNWNGRAERITDYRAEEIVGHCFSPFYASADLKAGLMRELEAMVVKAPLHSESAVG